MRIAIGYSWFPHSLGFHFERAISTLGHDPVYVGLPAVSRAGYDNRVRVADLLDALSPRPDLFVWIDPGDRYFPPGIEDAPIPTACYLVDVHIGAWRTNVARCFDAVFVAQKDYVPAYRDAVGHDQVRWLPLAAAPDVHRDHQLPRTLDVGFVGSVTRAHRRAGSRLRRLDLVRSQFKTNDVFAPATPEEVGRIYSTSRIVLNSSIAGDVTMRVFEGAACGALMLTDSVANGLGELFKVGEEIAVYRDDADMLDQIRSYLADDVARERIARAGQSRVLADHTYAHRIARVVEAVTAPGFVRAGPMRNASARERFDNRRPIYAGLHMLDALFDDARAARVGAVARAAAAAPVVARRLLR